MSDTPAVASRIAEFRDAFDGSFAVPSSSPIAGELENLLAIRVAGEPYALRLGEILGLATGKKTVTFPSSIPELLGIAGMRGGFVPVYSLAALLGCAVDVGQGRWLALCGSEETIGLAFRDFEGYLRIPLTELYATNQESVHEHVKHVIRTPTVVRGVVSIPHIFETIKRRCENARVSKE